MIIWNHSLSLLKIKRISIQICSASKSQCPFKVPNSNSELPTIRLLKLPKKFKAKCRYIIRYKPKNLTGDLVLLQSKVGQTKIVLVSSAKNQLRVVR